jgi:hypothetical protein
LCVIWINNNRIHWDVREIAGLIRPAKGAAVGSASYLENMPGSSRRISIESTYCRIPHGQIRGRHRRIERDAQHRAQRHNGVTAGHIHPVRLCLSTGAEVKAYPDIRVVCANHGDALILRRVLDLINERTIAQGLLGHILGGGIVRYIPVRSREGAVSAQDCFPHSRSACNEMAAPAWNTCRGTIIATCNTAMKKIVRQNE